MKITASAIKDLKAGGELYGDGLHVRKTKKGATYYASFNQDSERAHKLLGKESSGYNLARAKADIIQLRAGIAANSETARFLKKKDKPKRFDEAANDYIQILNDTGGKNIKQKAQQMGDHLIPAFGTLVLNGISSQKVQAYRAKRLRDGVKSSTVNREVATLNHFYSSAQEWGWCTHKPYKVANLKEDNVKIVRFTDEECDRLLQVAKDDVDPYSYLFVLVGLNTGMRHREILEIRFENVEWGKRRLFVPNAKAGPRYQPLTQVVVDALADEKTRRGLTVGFVFAADSKTGHRDYMKKQFKRVLSAAGLKPDRFTPHAMRHTAITRLIEHGVPIETVRKISGHKTLAMVMRYTHVADEHVDEAIETIQIG